MNLNIVNLVKISIVGHPAVGKTTILKLLSQNSTNNQRYLPTQGFDLNTVKFGNYKLNVWDFGGQKAYLKAYLSDYLLGSDIVFVVTDSTPRNVLTSKELIDHSIKIIGNDCPIIAIANKQDLCKADGRLNAKRVENVLHIKTHGLIAIKNSERTRMMGIIKGELDQVAIRRRLAKSEI